MDTQNILTTVMIIAILLGIIINYNSKVNIFGTNLISIGIIGFVCVTLYYKNKDGV